MLLVDWQWELEGWAPGGGGGGAAAGTKPRHNSASADRSCPAERLSSTHYYLLLLQDHPRLDPETWSLAKIRVPERFGGRMWDLEDLERWWLRQTRLLEAEEEGATSH